MIGCVMNLVNVVRTIILHGWKETYIDAVVFFPTFSEWADI